MSMHHSLSGCLAAWLPACESLDTRVVMCNYTWRLAHSPVPYWLLYSPLLPGLHNCRCAGMKQWLARYAREPGAQANEPTVLGHNVLRLELLGTADVEMSIRNMPFRALRQLRLHGLKVQLGPMNGHPGMLAAAEGLTWLSLEACELLGGSSSLLHLTALPALQHLEVTHNTVASRMASTDIPLSQLRRLTHLTLDSPFYGAQNIYGALGQLRGHGGDAATEHDSSTLAATSALTCLQELVVQVGRFVITVAVCVLPHRKRRACLACTMLLSCVYNATVMRVQSYHQKQPHSGVVHTPPTVARCIVASCTLVMQ